MIEAAVNGRANRITEALEPPARVDHEGRPVPDHVAIVAMGRSLVTYMTHVASKGSWRRGQDEVWAINGMAGCIYHDRAFIMDDLKQRTAPAAEQKPGGCADGMLSWMKDHPGPVYTARAYAEYPGTVEYPLELILNCVGNLYLNNSVAYAVAYAMAIGVPKVSLYGCDFSYPDRHQAESGRACVEMLLGMALTRGMEVTIAQDSTLLDAHSPVKFYGYATQPTIEREESTDAEGNVVGLWRVRWQDAATR